MANGVFSKFSAPKNGGASAANIKYITREPATGADERAIYLANLDHLKGKDYRETAINLKAFAETRLDEEQASARRGSKQARTHYRAILSFDRKEETEKAGQLAKQWLEKNFPNARAVAAVHQDSKNTHLHVWMDAKQMDERKIQISNKHYKTLDESWAEIYAREYGAHYLKEVLDKKQETKEFKKAKFEGRDVPRPQRARAEKKELGVKREERNYDKNGIGIYQRDPASETKNLSDTERAVNNSVDGGERTKKQIDDDAKNGGRRIQETIEILQLRGEADSRANSLYEQSRELAKRIELDREQREPTIERTFERERVRERVKG
jgi:hypothetical protein